MLPQKREVINIGDICFSKTLMWRVQDRENPTVFYHSGKTTEALQCKQTSMKFASDTNNVSVVCTWFIWHASLSSRRFVISPSSASHDSVINDYVFTLTEGCLKCNKWKTVK